MAHSTGVYPTSHTAKKSAYVPPSKQDREKLIKPYLPPPRKRSRSPAPLTSSQRRQGPKSLLSRSPRGLIALLLHKLLFHLIHLVFSVYITVRQTYHALLDRIFSILYYHHRTPELIRKDVKSLSRLPQHLSVIVDLKGTGDEAVRRLMGDVAELAAWCASAGIPQLSIYERSGILKAHIPELHHTTMTTFSSYFHRPQRPSLSVRAPNKTSYSPSPSSSRSPSPSPYDGTAESSQRKQQHLNLLLLSSHDGRDTLVDLTKTLAEMSQKRKLAPEDVTAELIHAEIEEATACKEPDLLVIMAEPAAGEDTGRRTRKSKRKQKGGQVVKEQKADSGHTWGGDGVCLRGYPPWQVRLTEIFHVQDSSGIGYQIFLRALHRYAKAEMRFGR